MIAVVLVNKVLYVMIINSYDPGRPNPKAAGKERTEI
jgi:hypothetical protein